MIVLDYLWILMLWVVIALFAAMAIGRASDLGKRSDNEDLIANQPKEDAALETPQWRHHSNRKRSAGSKNKNHADTNRGGVKEKQRKRAA